MLSLLFRNEIPSILELRILWATENLWDPSNVRLSRSLTLPFYVLNRPTSTLEVCFAYGISYPTLIIGYKK